MAKNPYTLLGVKKGATDAEIRKAYRAKAKKLHPDVNPGDKKTEERFKEVTAAYNLLTDKNLRAQYDRGQVDGSGQQQPNFAGGFGGQGSHFSTGFGGMGGMRGGGQEDMADLFSSLFGMNMGARRGGMNRPPMRAQKGADVRYKLKISFVDALKGGTQSLGPDLKVKIPTGIKSGQVLRLRGKGQSGTNGGPKGDAKIEVEVAPHKNLRREGNDLYLDLPISLHEALKGTKIKVNMPNGAVQLSIPAGTNSGQKMRLKGKGVKGGNLVVTPIIVLTSEEIKAEKKVLRAIPVSKADDLRQKLI